MFLLYYIFYKTWPILITFGMYWYRLNKFATKNCNYFPLHLNSVSTLLCEI